MSRCFVIQPFDGGRFDKRFEDVFKPAIESTGLEAYRVDKDPNVDVPVDAIEDGIKSSSICLADITVDNPNVWYELGYAFALGRPVIMVCSDERTGKKYPFDIQHRTIITYSSESLRDFEALKLSIVQRIKAFQSRADAFEHIRANEQIAPVEGLSQPELAVLAAIAGTVVTPSEPVSAYSAKNDTEKAGFTSIGYQLGVKRLVDKGFIEFCKVRDFNGESYQALVVTANGWNWIEQNESKFLLTRPRKSKSEEDLPF